MTTTTSTVRSWSTQQEAIFNFFTTESRNCVVVAHAGTGKTTTIIEAVTRLAAAQPKLSIVLCAFNKRIADELQTRLPKGNVQAKTLHSLGYAAVRRAWERIRINDTNKGDVISRADALAQRVCGGKTPDHVTKIVSQLHSKCREMQPHATLDQAIEIAAQFSLVPDEQWEAAGYDATYVATKALEAMEVAATDRTFAFQTGIDFADMIFLPVRNGWLCKDFDRVIVDEAQDMTMAQLSVALGSCRGNMMIVGDNFQAIYGFRGADSESISRLKAELNAVEFPLTVTYRCGKAIVALAQKFVPDFEAAATNGPGCILDLAEEKLVAEAGHGDFILSRLNAPLVGIAMSLLRNGKRARVAGKDIGRGLTALVNKLAKGAAAHSIPEFCERVRGWQDREVARWNKANKPAKVENVNDQAEMLLEMATGASSVPDLKNRIDALFTDDGLGQAGVITCSSVHKAKGLEANRVFVLASTLRNWNQEELNIQYVAITRAKSTLVMVGSAPKEN